jgi:hypothetical protein
MKYCPKCGTTDDDNTFFCKQCGAQLPMMGIASVSQQNVPRGPSLKTPPMSIQSASEILPSSSGELSAAYL